jgi:RNA recognition motif-containing protein
MDMMAPEPQEARYATIAPPNTQKQHDDRTTLMIRNVPRKHTQRQLLADLLAAYDFSGAADFFYLPTDLGTCRNLGYCFLNFVCPERALAAKQALHKLRLSSGAKSGLSIGYADFQGLEENLRNVRRSLMHRIKNREYRPLVADENGDLVPIAS